MLRETAGAAESAAVTDKDGIMAFLREAIVRTAELYSNPGRDAAHDYPSGTGQLSSVETSAHENHRIQSSQNYESIVGPDPDLAHDAGHGRAYSFVKVTRIEVRRTPRNSHRNLGRSSAVLDETCDLWNLWFCRVLEAVGRAEFASG